MPPNHRPAHLHSQLLLRDHGPGFHGWFAWLASGAGLCVAPHRVLTSPAARDVMRELVERAGGDCATCANCLVGQEVLARSGPPPPGGAAGAPGAAEPHRNRKKHQRVSKGRFRRNRGYRPRRD